MAAHDVSSSNVSCCGELDALLGHRNNNCNPFPNQLLANLLIEELGLTGHKKEIRGEKGKERGETSIANGTEILAYAGKFG